MHLRPPLFSSNESLSTKNFMYNNICGCTSAELSRDLSQLNSQQVDAVRRIAAAKDYLLLLGMPGTGKSSVLAITIRTLVAKGYRVLVTSYTHSAVDNLVAKLDEAKMVRSFYYLFLYQYFHIILR